MKKWFAILLASLMVLSLAGFAAAEDDITTLRVLVRSSTGLEEREEWNAKLNEMLLDAGMNVQLEWYAQPSSGYTDFISTMLLTWDEGDIYDIIYHQGSDPAYFGAMDLLVDMTPYVETSTNLKKYFENDPVLAAQFASCPYQLWPSAVNSCMQVRTDLLEKCDSYAAFQAAPTLEAYTLLFEELKALDDVDATLTVQGINYLMETGFDSGFGITNTWLKQDDGSYVYARVSDQFLAELNWWADMYKEGVLDANFATDNWESMENALYTGEVAGIAMKGGAYTVYYDTNTVKNYGEEASLTILPPMVSEDGAQQYNITGTRFDRGMVISSTCENPQLAFDVLDFMLSDEGRILDLFGVEGSGYTLNEDGTYKLNFNSSELKAHYIFDGDVFGDIDVLAVTSGGVEYWPAASFESAEFMTKYGKVDNNFVIPEQYATQWDACETLWKEFATQFILGEKTEADWADFVATWNSYGGSDVAAYAATVIEG